MVSAKLELLGMKTSTITSKGQVVIPKEVREIEGFKKGTKIAILTFKDRVELRPWKQFNEKMALTLASEKSLAKEWLSKEDEAAWKDL